MVKKMRELSLVEVQQIAGAGFIQDGLTSLGSLLGGVAYQALNAAVNISIPLVGSINLGTFFPDLGKNVGSTIGNKIGGTIESTLTGLPVVGDFFGKILA